MNLETLFRTYGSDKWEHGYHTLYEKYLPVTVNKFLEIGVWHGGGIRAFKEWYNNHGGRFYGVDYMFGDGSKTQPESIEQFFDWGIIAVEGSQDDLNFLRRLPKDFDVIVDDGSHHSDQQNITFKEMFVNNLKSGGLYVCEDVHGYYDEFWRRGKVKSKEDTLVGVLMNYNLVQPVDKVRSLISQYFTVEDSATIAAMIESVHIHNQIVFVKKK